MRTVVHQAHNKKYSKCSQLALIEQVYPQVLILLVSVIIHQVRLQQVVQSPLQQIMRIEEQLYLFG